MKKKILVATLSMSFGMLCSQSVLAKDIDYTRMQRYVESDGDIVYGYWGADGLCGFGMCSYLDADGNELYEGFFEDGQRNYWGVYTFNDGAMFIGSDIDGVSEGMGVYMLDDGSIFIGNLVDGVLNGEGMVFNTKEEEFYFGRWEDGMKVKEYSYDKWESGNIFHAGTNVNGNLEGLGCWVNFETEEVHIGEFDNGEANGIGLHVFKDEDWEVAKYLDGEARGYVAYFGDEGDKLLGYRIGDEYIGDVAYYSTDGKMLVLDEKGNIKGSIVRD